jgi:hypothetical protein
MKKRRSGGALHHDFWQYAGAYAEHQAAMA